MAAVNRAVTSVTRPRPLPSPSGTGAMRTRWPPPGRRWMNAVTTGTRARSARSAAPGGVCAGRPKNGTKTPAPCVSWSIRRATMRPRRSASRAPCQKCGSSRSRISRPAPDRNPAMRWWKRSSWTRRATTVSGYPRCATAAARSSVADVRGDGEAYLAGADGRIQRRCPLDDHVFRPRGEPPPERQLGERCARVAERRSREAPSCRGRQLREGDPEVLDREAAWPAEHGVREAAERAPEGEADPEWQRADQVADAAEAARQQRVARLARRATEPPPDRAVRHQERDPRFSAREARGRAKRAG